MTAQAPLAGEPVPGSRLLLDFLHLPGELGAEQRGAGLGLGRIFPSPPPGLPSPRPLIHGFRILEAWNPLGSAARGPQCCVWKCGASSAWGRRLSPVRLLRAQELRPGQRGQWRARGTQATQREWGRLRRWHLRGQRGAPWRAGQGTDPEGRSLGLWCPLPRVHQTL